MKEKLIKYIPGLYRINYTELLNDKDVPRITKSVQIDKICGLDKLLKKFMAAGAYAPAIMRKLVSIQKQD